MKILIAALFLLSFASCQEDPWVVRRGPGGFTKEEFQVDFDSIPHSAVRHFNGLVLVLDLNEANVESLKSDWRFQWAKPSFNGHYILGDELFMDGGKFEIFACHWEEPGAVTGREWKMIAIDPTRRRLFAAVDTRPYFKGFATPKPDKEIEQGAEMKRGQRRR